MSEMFTYSFAKDLKYIASHHRINWKEKIVCLWIFCKKKKKRKIGDSILFKNSAFLALGQNQIQTEDLFGWQMFYIGTKQ